MFKKSQDQMFRRAQMKLFSMIAGILLAVFILIIISINVMTKFVMRGQSKDVLMQIAASIEYDDQAQNFEFTPPSGSGEQKEEKRTEPPQKPTETQTEEKTDSTEAPSTTEKPTSSEAASETESSRENRDYEEHRDDQPSNDQPYEEPQQTSPQNPQQEDKPSESQQEARTEWTAPTVPENGNNNQQWGGWTWGMWGYDPNQSGKTEKPTENNNNGGDNNNQWGGWGTGGYGDNNNNNNNWGGNQVWPGYIPYDPNYSWGGYTKSYSSEPKKEGAFDSKAYLQEHGVKSSDSEETDTEEADSEPRLLQTVYGGEDVFDGFTVLSDRNGESSAAAYKSNSEKAGASAPAESRVELIPRNLGSIEYFVIMSDHNGNYLAKLYNESIDADTAQDYITAIRSKGIDTGMYRSYQYYQADKDNGTLMVFTDKSYEINMLRQLKRTTVIIGSIALIFLSVLAYFLSKKSIQPIKIAFNKQKQFVSDASHELKTPLTVISTNADVLTGEIGDNKWLNYIKSQTDRMSVLVNDLLNLTRLENNTDDLENKYFNMSKAIINTALPFECRAFDSNKKFEVNVDEDVMLCASEKHIKQMAAIFIDNALKYSNDGGTIRVSLQKVGDRKIFSVFNTGQGIKEEEKEKIFERFYRSDESRNRATGGYGLGLAIAKSIIDKHKFKLHVLNQPGKSICFIVTM